MIKHIIAFLCISSALSLLGIAFAGFGAADCAAVSVIVLAVYAAAYRIRHRKKGGCSGCSGCCSNCIYGEKCQNTENHKNKTV